MLKKNLVIHFVRLLTLCIFLIFFSAISFAEENIPVDIVENIKSNLLQSRPDLKFDSIEKTKIHGLYLIRVDSNQFFYVEENGEYLIVGDMYQAKPFGFVAVVAESTLEMRKNSIKKVLKKNMIIFPSLSKAREILYVFTDVDCHFCRKFHNDALPNLTSAGVEVRYLSYPRAGTNSESYKKMASAWCADDKNEALSKLKNREAIDEYICDENPISNQIDLGQKIGITGTPAMLMEDGTLLMGYRPANKLLEIIASH